MGRMSSLEDESVFQLARKIRIAQLQNIVYTEYLPLVLGTFNCISLEYMYTFTV